MPRFSKRKKAFGLNHGQPLDQDQKKRVMKNILRHNKVNKSGKQHVGPITRTAIKVAEVLLYRFHNSKSGQCFPSYEAIAEAAGCARSTVHKAIRALEDAGILTWIHRVYRMAISSKRQLLLRTSNAYIITIPEQIFTEILGEARKSENQSGTHNQDILYKRRPGLRLKIQGAEGIPRPRTLSRYSARKQIQRLTEATLLQHLNEATVDEMPLLTGRFLVATSFDGEQVRGMWAISRETVALNPASLSGDAAKRELLNSIRRKRFAQPCGFEHRERADVYA